MTPRQIELVRKNLGQIEQVADEVSTRFYDRLFALDPALRRLFKNDLSEQKTKLMMMLKFAVGALDRIEIFEPSLENLGRKHAGYGVRDEHYETVGASLILTLREMLGANLTSELETAWRAAYERIAGSMLAGAVQARSQAA